jgi:hypothetical protein
VNIRLTLFLDVCFKEQGYDLFLDLGLVMNSREVSMSDLLVSV